MIVCGVDGSPASERALAWAADEARLRGVGLRVVHAWLVPLLEAMPEPFLVGVPAPPLDQAEILDATRAAAEEALHAELERVLGESPRVQVEALAVEGRAAERLVEAADGADLLVVGSRGRGGFKGLLLGSVSQQVAQHAPCPVVIVRP
jgi:nucleotide-binding universal stress UspA family protein